MICKTAIKKSDGLSRPGSLGVQGRSCSGRLSLHCREREVFAAL